ncbi:MAG: ribose 5-phosphate isomerase B [Planctomycetes bacterium]|nr:ribose 5-phosphate isomerase B [Planctomycetota bacterium]MCA8934839.1 ribose 5-phosphate isomerase B [Planctomycetota bacterium]
MKIAIAADHAAFDMKNELVAFLRESGNQVDDLGPFSADRVDYPDFAARACARVADKSVHRVVLVCGSGIGMAMSANKISGCRAVVAHNSWEAEMARRHNDANVICFGSRSMGIDVVKQSLAVFIATEFDGGRHTGRVAKMSKLDGSAISDVPGE